MPCIQFLHQQMKTSYLRKTSTNKNLQQKLQQIKNEVLAFVESIPSQKNVFFLTAKLFR